MELVFGYLAGLLTLINPCVLPVLPIALASALQNDRLGPVWLATGMSVTFVALGVGVTALGSSFGIDSETIATGSAALMIIFGLILLVPAFNNRFSLATAGISSSADISISSLDQQSVRNQLLGGALLGAVWSPCIGPTLGGAISLASQGNDLMRATGIMIAFAAGISTIILALAYGAREAIRKRQERMRVLADKAKPIMGITFVVIGIIILFRWNQIIEGWLLDIMPIWLQDLSVVI